MSINISDIRVVGRNGHTTFLQSKEDLDWLYKTHILVKINHTISYARVPRNEIKSAILVGNENSPNFIEIYSSQNPKFGDSPIFRVEM